MSAIARTDTSLVTRWWWTVDRLTLAALAAIAAWTSWQTAAFANASLTALALVLVLALFQNDLRETVSFSNCDNGSWQHLLQCHDQGRIARL